MCLAVPGQVVALGEQAHTARVDVLGATRDVDVFLLGDGVATGDWVLVHVGFAIARVDEAEAKETLALLEAMLAAEKGADSE